MGFYSDLMGYQWNIPSGELTNSYGKWPIEIDGLPIKNGGSFHGKMLVHQRVTSLYPWKMAMLSWVNI